MAMIQSDWASGKKNVPHGHYAGELVVAIYTIDAADISGASASDVVEIGCLPARHRLWDIWWDAPDMDSNGSPTLDVDMGILSGEFGDDDGTRTVGTEFYDDSTAFGSGAVSVVKTTAISTTLAGLGVSDTSRGIGLLINTAAATAVTSGTFTLGMAYFSPSN